MRSVNALSKWKSTWLPLLLILVIVVLPHVVSNEYYIRIVSISLIYIILALSLNLLYGFAGQISFGHAGFFAIGAYLSSLIELKLRLGFVVSFLLTILICFVLSWMISFPILKLKDHYLGMATLAFGLLIYTIAMQWVSMTGGPGGLFVPASTIFGVPVSNIIYYLTLVFTVLCYILSASLLHSKIGLALRAIAGDEWAAKSSGIDVVSYKTLVFSLSGAMAGLAGILYAQQSGFISPEAFGLHVSIMILTMVVIGGLGSNQGAIIGAVFLTLLPEIIDSLNDMKMLVYGVLLLVVLVFLPNGLVSLFSLSKRSKAKGESLIDT